MPLSTAFLIVYVLTLISWVVQKRSLVRVYENGVKYKKFNGSWAEIESARVVEEGAGRRHIEIQKNKREKIAIPSSILGFDQIVGIVRSNVKTSS